MRPDLRAIITYIAEENPEAAQDLKDGIETLVDALPRNPKTREMLVTKNYLVVYAETRNLIWIVRVLHTSRQWP